MALCTLAQFQARIPSQLRKSLSDDAAGETENTTIIQRALDEAEALAYSYIEGRYTTPLSSVPIELTQITADIAFYNLGGRWGESAKGEPDISPYTNAIKALEAFRSGTKNFYGGGSEKTLTWQTTYEQIEIPTTNMATDDFDDDYEEA